MAEDANAKIRVDIDTAAALASIKNLQRQISNFHTSMAKSGAAASAASMQLQQQLLNNINRTGQFSATIKNVKTTTDSFTSSLEKNKLSMGEYFRYSGAATKTFGRLFRTEFDTINKVARERVKDLQTQYIKMGRDANGAMQAIAVRPLSLDMRDLGTQTQIAAQRQALLNQMLKQGSTNLLNFGKNTQWAGRQLMVGFTIPLVMLGSVASKTFMDMEKQAIRFKRVYGELFTTTEETARALDEIKNLANEFTKYGIAVSKTMELAADIAATGKMGANLTAQVAEATRLAVLGGVEQQEALKATISLTDAFGVSARNLAGEIDFLNAVENQTVTSIEDLTIAIPKAGPVVQQLGGDVQDLTFFLTAMREGGINASEGANALKSGLASMINPAEKSAKFLESLGINLKGIVEANKGDIKGIVIQFANALDTLDPLNRARAIEQLFGKFQFARLSTLFQNVTREGNQASRVLKLANSTAAELAILSERELKKVEDSPMFKFQKAVEDIKVTLVPLGEAFLKAVTPVLEFGTKILEKFNELDAGAKQFVVGLTAIAGVIGPVFLMGFGLIANGVANVIKGFVFFKTAMNKASSASTQLGIQTEYMTQQQLEASAVAASLDQVHQKLRQTFTSEAGAVDALTAAYRRSIAAQTAMGGGVIGRTRTPKKYASGVLSVPGPRGAGDVVPAMLSPGEAVIPAKQASKYSGFISSMISDNVPGFRFGRNPFASILGRSNVGVRMQSQAFSQALASGNKKYQSGFATGTGDDFLSKYGLNKPKQKQLRTKLEQSVFGLPGSTSASQRPTYGFASSSPLQAILNTLLFGKTGARASAAMNPRSSKLDRYGDISLITKGSVAKRSSAYAGDILLDYSRNKNLSSSPAPMRGATTSQSQAAQFGRFGQPFGNIPTGGNSFTTNPKPPYIETYTPGGFAFKEIDKIIARNPAIAKQLRAELKEAGLGSVRVSGSNFAARLFKKIGIPGYKDGVFSVPGPKGAGDVVPSMLSPGEAVIPARQAKKYSALVHSMIADNVPGFEKSNVKDKSGMVVKDVKLSSTTGAPPASSLNSSNVKAYTNATMFLPSEDNEALRAGKADPAKLAASLRSGGALAASPFITEIVRSMGFSSQAEIDKALKDPKIRKDLTTFANNFSSRLANEVASSKGPMTDAKFAKISDKIAKEEAAKRGPAFAKATQQVLTRITTFEDKSVERINKEGKARARGRSQVFANIPSYKNKKDSYVGTGKALGLSGAMPARAVMAHVTDPIKVALSKLAASGPLTATAQQAKKLLDAGKKIVYREGDASKKITVPGNTTAKQAIAKLESETSKTNAKTVKEESKTVKEKAKVVKEDAKTTKTKAATVKVEKQTQAGAKRADAAKKGWETRRAKATPTPTIDPNAPESGRRGMGIGTAGMVASAAVMGGSMLPGQIGKVSQDLMMPVMAISMIAPLLKNMSPVFLGLLAAAGALTAGIINFAIAADRGRKEGISLAQAMTLTNEKLIELSKITGTVSATEMRQKEQADRISAVNNAQVSNEADVLLESEFGQKFLEEAKNVSRNMPSPKIAAQAFASQLSSAVAQGVITTDQAKALGEKIGQELDSKEFSIEVVATINKLLGPRGENLGKEPLKVLLEIQKIQQGQIDTAFQAASSGQQSLFSPETLLPGSVGAALSAKGVVDFAAGKAANTAAKIAADVAVKQTAKVAGGLAVGALAKIGVGAAASATGAGAFVGIPLMIAGIAEIGIGSWQIYEAFAAAGKIQEENNRLNSMALTMGMQQIINNEQLLDSLNSQYDAKEAELEAQIAAETNLGRRKKLESELNDLIAKRASDTSALNSANADVMASVRESAKGLGLDELKSKALEQNKVTNANDIFKRDATAGAIEGISKLQNQDDLEAQLLLSVSMGVIPTEIASLLALASQENPQVGVEYMALVSSRGTAEANEITALLAAGGVDKDGTKFPILLEYMQTGDIDAVAELIKLRTYGIEIDLDVNGQERIDAAAKTLKDLEDQPDVITVDIAADIDSSKGDVYEKIMKEWQSQVGPDGVLSLPALSTVSLLVPEVTITQVNEYLAKKGIYSNMLTTEQKLALYSIPVAIELADIDKGGNVPKVEEETPKPTGTRKADPLDNLLKSLQNVRKATIDAQGKTDELFKLFEKGKNISVFRGIENQLLNLSSNLDFINFISGLDKAEQALFFTMEKGNLVLTKRGLLTEKGFNAKAVGDFVLAQQKVVLSSQNELKARNLLIKAGYSYAEAVDLSRDAEIQAAFASAAATKGKVARKKAIEDVTKALKQGLDAEKSVQTAEEKFAGLYDRIQDKLDADRSAIELKFKLDTAADDKIIEDAQNKIAAIQYKIDDQEAGLTLISDKEGVINEKYDKRLEALDKIQSVNESISQQQRNQLSLADALSSGDIGAAARAMQQIQEDFVGQSSAKQKDLIEKARQQELLKVSVSINGELKTREQIEKTIKDLQKEIFELEEKSLEPAVERNRLLTIARDASIKSLDLEADKWAALETKINLAKTSVENYAKALVEANALATGAVKEIESGNPPSSPVTPADDSKPAENTFKGTRPGPDREGKKGEVWVGPEATWKHDGTKWNKISDVGRNNQKPPVQNTNTNTNTGNPDKVTKKEQADALKRQVAANEKLIGDQLAIIRGVTAGLVTAGDRLGKAKNAMAKAPPLTVNPTARKAIEAELTAAQKAYDKLLSDRDIASGKANKFTKDNAGLKKQISDLGFRSGGFVSGPGTATSDSVPAMLSNGEYVINASSVNKFGEEVFDRLNSGQLPKFRLGGLVADGGSKRKPQPKNLKPSGPFQNFEAGFQSVMAKVAENPIIKSIGEFINGDHLGGKLARGAIGVLSTPAEIMGAIAKNIVDTKAATASKIKKGNIAGAAGRLVAGIASNIPKALVEGTANAFAGTLDPSKAQPSMFEKAAKSAIENNFFNAKTDPEMASLARIIGGTLNLAGDPLTYIGVGAASKAAKLGRKMPENALLKTEGNISLSEFTDAYMMKQGRRPIAFEGQLPKQDFSGLSQSGTKIVPTTPQGLLEEAIGGTSSIIKKIKLNAMLNNFKNNKIGKNEIRLLDNMGSAMVRKTDEAYNLDGLSTVIRSLSGDRGAGRIVSSRTSQLLNIIEKNKAKNYETLPGGGGTDIADPSKISAIHSTSHEIVRDKKGNIILRPAGEYLSNTSRGSVHFSLEDTVKSHLYGQWANTNKKIVSPLSDMMKNNGMPYNINSTDTWWMRNPGESLKISNAAVVSPYTDLGKYTEELVQRGLFTPKPNNMMPPEMVVDKINKEVLHMLPIGTAGQSTSFWDDIALKAAKELVGTNTTPRRLEQWSLNDANFESSLRNLADSLKVRRGIHSQSPVESLEQYGLKNLSWLDSAAAMRFAALKGQIQGRVGYRSDFSADENMFAMGGLVKPKYFNAGGMVNKYAMGGKVKPKYFNAGGFAMGTDTIPSMLTPGEFVVKKRAVENFGVDNLSAINSGTSLNDSVYNYSINVNVKTDANANQIAQTVMTQIKQIDSQRIRGVGLQ
jgi:TP901 family phage tail tape measure protein